MSSRFDARPSRRDLLKALPLAGVLASCRPRPYDRADFTVPARSAVALLAASSYDADLADLIGRGLRELAIDVRGKSVLLKPNLVEYAPNEAINTNPRVVAGAVVACLRAGARTVTVGEGPGHRRDLEYLLGASGLGAALRDLRIAFVDLNHDDVRAVRLRSWFTGLRELFLPETLLRAEFVVSMPKLKTHHWAGMTASMKNLFGVLPGAIYGWPKNILHVHGIEPSIVDLSATVRPHLAIVDAIVGMEGDGPIMGAPRALGFLAMSADLVAADATCARVIGLDPAKIGYLAEAGRFLGNADAARLEQRGESPSRFATRVEIIEAFHGIRLPPGSR
jgi:uncharacterized protein (DUF362 family)